MNSTLKGVKMKIIAINGSPSGKRSNTDLLLLPFLEGAREAGAEVDLFYIAGTEIRSCTGEFHCWLREPGNCYINDPMIDIYAKLRVADVWIFAAPLFASGIPGPLKTFIDRMIPLVLPFVQKRGGITRHIRRGSTGDKKVILISNCGFMEKAHFKPMVFFMKDLCKNWGVEFSAALLRSGGPGLRHVLLEEEYPIITARAKKIPEACKRAGIELVHRGKISWWVRYLISRRIVPVFYYNKKINERFKVLLARIEKK